MENYPSNSDRSKKEGETHERLKPVIDGGVKKQKKNGIRKFADIFLEDDVKDIKSYVIFDLLIPSIKKFVLDSMETALLGSGSTRRSDRDRGYSGSVRRIDYRGISDDRRTDSTRRSSEARRPGFDYEDLIFEDRGSAERVLAAMDEILDRYHVVSVFDMYDLAGMDAPYTYENYGWTSIASARAERLRTGEWTITMPRALPIR